MKLQDRVVTRQVQLTHDASIRVTTDTSDGTIRVDYADPKLETMCRATTLVDALEGALRGTRYSHRFVEEYIRATNWGTDLP
jgi:hypothetical protein